jgi:hypothetical protein
MEPAETIERIGFKRWYERQLVEGHAWFVTCFLCLLAVAAVLEELTFRGPLARVLAYGAIVFAAGALALYALARYRRIMEQAERLGDQATCGGCGTYARFRLVAAPLTVRCRRCDNQWSLLGAPAQDRQSRS